MTNSHEKKRRVTIFSKSFEFRYTRYKLHKKMFFLVAKFFVAKKQQQLNPAFYRNITIIKTFNSL